MIDQDDIFEKIESAQTLGSEELLKMADLLSIIGVVKKNLSDLADDFRTKQLSGSLGNHTKMVEEIHKCIDENGWVRDNASEKLKEIRDEQKKITKKIRKEIENFVNSHRNFLQEPVATIRDGRHVFPVKASYKSQIKGIVHSVSSTAVTYFVEPEQFVPLNNNIRELRDQEQDEINKILRDLTLRLFDNWRKIKSDLQTLAYIDSLYARAVFALKYNAHVIYPSQEGVIKLISARHPLIDPQKVVAIDVELAKDKCGLVITGPNTGGKTVTLKTVGLFCSMMMAGFPLTCDKNSKLPGFSKIVIDVGDEQDIQQNLSTFSSHMANIARALSIADQTTLVLLDELGSGTDPMEGAALALAIMDKLKQSGCKFIATTHLTPVKVYAANDDNFVSASVEFDPETLKPTYRVLMGVPGASHAFEIARKLGVDETILENARRLMGEDYMNIEKAIEKYQKQSIILQEKIRALEEEQEELKKIKEEYKKKYERLKKGRVEELDEELKNMYNYIKEMKKQIDEAISNVRKRDRDLEALRNASKIFERQSRTIRKMEMLGETALSENITTGDTVQLKNGGAIGKVVGMRGEKFVVDFSGIKIEAYSSSLVKIPPEKLKDSSNPHPVFSYYNPLSKPEIDVRGLTVEEAEPLVEDFIDKLVLSEFKVGYVIHGKGTGRLAVGIWEVLRRDGRVKKYRFGTPSEGGTGVTVVEV
ncbi:MAG: mismatch repair protein MutS2 [Pseudothermotoga sp.]|nr:mismatch repair protein MutS2 [Pseudothermotoga sp.]